MSPGADPIFSAVEAFIALRESGDGTRPDEFASRYPNDQQPEIARQCRMFLEVDDWLGPALADAPAEAEARRATPRPITDPATAASSPAAPEPGERRLGDFRILSEIGRGGMGVVYLADQLSLDRQVALKVLSQGLSFSARHAERFRREAAAAARLQHHSIVPIFASGEIDGTLYYAMEHVRGPDLGDVMKEARESGQLRSITDTASLVAELARGLACAHEANIVHRDIKPRNILIAPDGRPRILDFGLAKDLALESVSLSGEMAGTPHYMSPEQTLAKRAPLDHRTDIFSLGVVLYELLTDQRPFDSDDLQQLVYQICFQEPTTIGKLNQQAPRDLVTICTKALEKDPAARYQTAAEMAEDLERFGRHEPILARPATAVARARKWIRRHRPLAATTSTILSIVIIGTSWLWYDHSEARAQSRDLLAEAAAAEARGDHKAAANLALGALEINNSERVKLIVSAIQERSRTAAVHGEYEVVTQAARAMKSDPDLALILALDGSSRHPGHLANNTVLDALDARYDSVHFEGHDRRVNRITLNQKGTRIATAADDGTARIWNLQGEQLRSINASMHWVISVAFSPDGESIVTTSIDKKARVWDTETGVLVCEYSGHDTRPMSVQFDRSGTKILTAGWFEKSEDAGSAHLWNATTGATIKVFAGHEGKLQFATFSPDGERILTGAADGTARIWNTTTGTCQHVLRGHQNYITKGTWRADGKQVVTACKDGCARIFDTESGERIALLRHSAKVWHASFSPDGTRVVTTSEDHTLRLWDSATGFEVRVLTQHDAPIVHASFDPTGKYLATAASDQTARIFEVATGQELAVLKHRHREVKSVTFHPDGKTLITLAGNDELRAWDINDAREVLVLHGHPDIVNYATFDQTGDRVATAGQDGVVRIWDAHEGKLLHALPRSPNTAKWVDFSAEGQHVVIGTGGRAIIYSLDSKPGSGATAEIDLDVQTRRVYSAEYSADGKHIVTTGRGDSVRIFNAVTGELEREIDDTSDPVFACLAPDGQRLVVCADDPTVTVYDRSTGKALFRLRGHSEPTHRAAWSSDGTRLLTASRDGTAMLWNGQSGDLLRRFEGHEEALTSAALSERFALTASSDGTARAWDLETGKPWLTIDGHRGNIRNASFSPDGTRIVTASHDRTARIWPSDPVKTAQNFSLRVLTHAERTRYAMLEPIHHEAEAIVDALFDDKILAREVKEALEADSSLRPELRLLATAIADERGDPDADRVHKRLRAVILPVAVELPIVVRALRRAEALTRLKPKDPYFRSTLALALLRHGDHREALETIRLSREISEQTKIGSRPYHFAILAMAHHHLGEHDQARAYFEELETSVQTDKRHNPEEGRRLLRETEALIRAR